MAASDWQDSGERQGQSSGRSPAPSEVEGAVVVPLAGDASTRRFYRILRPEGSAVVMDYGHSLDASAEAYLKVAAYLDRIGVRVPRILEVDRARGRVLLEDLGDDMLQAIMESGPREGWRAIYEQAIDAIVRMQNRGAADPDFTCPAFHISMDAARLLWELDYFRRHYLEGLERASLTDAERGALQRGFVALCEELMTHPYVLCHRDYHARNIMVCRGQVALVDFQDARLGPRTYDLASLLRDSYVTLDDATVRGLLDRYAGGVAGEALRNELCAVSVQRNLKALGTFGYMIGVKGDERYRPAIPRTLGYLSRSLPQLSRHEDLVEVLVRHLPLPG